MIKLKHDFCCDAMLEAIKETKIIDYSIKVREYGILVGANGIRMLHFCPWCGKKLPKDLRGELFDVLENEYGIPWEKADVFECTNIPKEFKTDEWWKKRGL